jgi:RNA polymerase sigma-70 factor (ECF subfamily)
LRRRGFAQHDAQDHAQGFFVTLLRRNSFASVAAHKGRLRTFLLASLDHFLADEFSARTAAKRGGGMLLIELDALEAEQRFALEPATDETPDKAFDRRWAAAMVEQSFARLAQEQTLADKGPIFARLKPLLGREVEPGEYETLAAELNLTPNTIAKNVQRLRQRARELLVEEAALTVAAAGDAERELRELFR